MRKKSIHASIVGQIHSHDKIKTSELEPGKVHWFTTSEHNAELFRISIRPLTASGRAYALSLNSNSSFGPSTRSLRNLPKRKDVWNENWKRSGTLSPRTPVPRRINIISTLTYMLSVRPFHYCRRGYMCTVIYLASTIHTPRSPRPNHRKIIFWCARWSDLY